MNEGGELRKKAKHAVFIALTDRYKAAACTAGKDAGPTSFSPEAPDTHSLLGVVGSTPDCGAGMTMDHSLTSRSIEHGSYRPPMPIWGLPIRFVFQGDQAFPVRNLCRPSWLWLQCRHLGLLI